MMVETRDEVDFVINTLTGVFYISYRCGRCGQEIQASGCCLNLSTMACYMGDLSLGYDNGSGYVCPVCLS